MSWVGEEWSHVRDQGKARQATMAYQLSNHVMRIDSVKNLSSCELAYGPAAHANRVS